jgi:hypothetical protein
VPSAVELSSDIGLIAVGLLTTNILLGLLVSVGYNPLRKWPRKRIKLFKFHNWTGYIALAVSALHPIVLLFSRTAGFGVFDILVPVKSPVQPFENSIGAVGFYCVPIDWIDGEKVFIEACLLLVAGATITRVVHARRARHPIIRSS